MTNAMKTKLFTLLSGGLDSTVVLGTMLDKHFPEGSISPDICTAVSIDYGQRHRVELDAAARIAQFYNVEHRVIPLDRVFGKSMLTDPKEAIPHASYKELPHGISPTYVPFRNGLMLSILAATAQSWVRKDENHRQAVIAFGAHAEDAENWAYPDCTPEFIGAMANAIFIGTYRKVRLAAPFMQASKAQIVTEGVRINAPLDMTWSCYAGGDGHCGVCPTCQARKAAFFEAGVADPTAYVR